ncbi:hypothetical protein RSSM_05679 [Rhodopirellula sallentina SM41]|uniref:Uncharacterized protein n=1 Tax=Rhodopirellula sallentina SM41 TaxID=1263870 RepID=M5TUM4_9BACT|nr:hypothetical protein RSSM_05679 [Rhodopirellula sallentina SM41]
MFNVTSMKNGCHFQPCWGMFDRYNAGAALSSDARVFSSLYLHESLS